MEWAEAATIVSALAAFTGLQALWTSRALDRVHASLDRLDTKIDRVEGIVSATLASVSRDSKPRSN